MDTPSEPAISTPRVADVAALSGDEALSERDQRHLGQYCLEENVSDRRRRLVAHGEAFGGNYELPNETAYNETCAAIAQALFNHRMFLLSGDGKYIDVLERIIYNGFLSGVSMSGDRFFYPNPLACNGRSTIQSRRIGTQPMVRLLLLPGQRRAIYSVDRGLRLRFHRGFRLRQSLCRWQRPRTRRRHGSHAAPSRHVTRGMAKCDSTSRSHTPASLLLRLRIPGWVEGRPSAERFVSIHVGARR